jgi:aerotaxis receptor
MNELAATVKSNTLTAAEASALSQGAREAAEQGGKVMSGMIQMMGNIGSSSDQIASITSIIDSIAFQTNILALNAAEAPERANRGKVLPWWPVKFVPFSPSVAPAQPAKLKR